MASNNTKAKVRGELSSVPVMAITMVFFLKLKAEYQPDNKDRITSVGDVDVTKLPLTEKRTLTIERLKGFQYGEEFKALMGEKTLSTFYGIDEIRLFTPVCEDGVKATLRGLTDGFGLLTFMLNNATKLYLSPVDRKLGKPVKDRNYSEICGKFHAEDVTKASVSTSGIKFVKEDIKDISLANSVLIANDHEQSPIRSVRNGLLALPGMAARMEQAKLDLAAKKADKKLLASSK